MEDQVLAGTDRDDRTVTGRVLAVLEAVAGRSHGATTLAELARATGIPKPTVRRLAVDLVRRGLLDRAPDGYRLGGRLLELGASAALQHGLRDAAMPHVQELCARTGEIAWIYAVSGTTLAPVGYVFRGNRAEVVRGAGLPIGLGHPALPQTAAGRVLLSERPDLLASLVHAPPAVLTRYSVTSWARLRRHTLRAVRDTGVAVEHEEGALGYSCVATGVHGLDGALVGVIGVTGRSGTLAPRLGRVLAAAAEDIARGGIRLDGTLGARP